MIRLADRLVGGCSGVQGKIQAQYEIVNMRAGPGQYYFILFVLSFLLMAGEKLKPDRVGRDPNQQLAQSLDRGWKHRAPWQK